MKKFSFSLVILFIYLFPSSIFAQIDKTIKDVKKGTQQANEAKHAAEETIQTGKDIIAIFTTLKKTKESRFIIIPDISIQDKNFAALKNALLMIKKVRDVATDFNQDTASIRFAYKDHISELWGAIPSTLHELFDVKTMNERVILLQYKYAENISGSAQPGSMQKTSQSDNSVGNNKSSNPDQEKSKNRGGENGNEQFPSENLSGSLHPEVKYLDVDYFSFFNAGSAIIVKGSANALIDAKGNIIVPFNTYKFFDFRDAGFNHQSQVPFFGYPRKGLYKIDKGGALNSNGQWIGKEMGASPASQIFSADGKFTGSKGMLTDAAGKIYRISGGVIKDVSEDIVTIWEIIPNSGGHIRYKTLNDQYITSAIYEDADIFSDGMALVGKKDEFSVLRYGFINKSGTLKIPLQFSIKPGRFSSGFARVIPKNQNEFEYGYIDKSGNVVIRQSRSEVQKYGLFGDFQHGYAFSPGYVMDTQGNIRSHQEWLSAFGVKMDPQIKVDLIQYNSGIRVFSENDHKVRYRKYVKSTGERIMGCVDVQTGKIIEGPFVESLFTLQFDPVSKLAYAKMNTGKDEKGHPTYREGFINEDGLFVIVKGSGSRW